MCALSRLSAVAFGVGPATASRAEQWCAVARGLQAGVEGPFPPLQLTMLWNLCVDMTSSGAPVLDRLYSGSPQVLRSTLYSDNDPHTSELVP